MLGETRNQVDKTKLLYFFNGSDLFRKVVQNCIESLGDITVDVETLINVADCAKDSANFWIKNNMPQ